MAPVTRARRNRAHITGENIEPLSPALTTNTPTPTRPSNNHVRFDQEEEDMPTAAPRTGSEVDEIEKGMNGDRATQVNGMDSTQNEVADSQEDGEEDSDDDAPEAVSMDAGKREAEKREEDAKRAVEVQKEASKKKRKERDTKLKEQRVVAEERKRERDIKRRKLEVAEDEQDAAISDQLTREATAVDKETESIPIPTGAISKRPKSSLLLPESLLAQVSARPSPPAAEDDSDSDPEMDGGALVSTGKSAGVSARLEKNRRRREQKKKNKILKKGVVNVKILRDEAASRKSMAPPASRQVAHIKESWLHKHRKGGIERRSVGGGFIRKK